MRELTILVPDGNEKLLSVKECADRIGISKDTIYAAISCPERIKCQIPKFRRNGRRILFYSKDVDEFVKGGSDVR